MSKTVDFLSSMTACACGVTGVKQEWQNAEQFLIHKNIDLTFHLFQVSKGPLRTCPSCNLYQWRLQPYVPFILTQKFEFALPPYLAACGCGGGGIRIRQTFEDILRVYPYFHSHDFNGQMLFDRYCEVCHYICWQALSNIPSIVPLALENGRPRLFLELEVEKPIIKVKTKSLRRGRIIERVEG